MALMALVNPKYRRLGLSLNQYPYFRKPRGSEFIRESILPAKHRPQQKMAFVR